MSRALSILLALLAVAGGALPVTAAEEPEPATTTDTQVVPGEVIVKWRDAAAGPAVAEARGLSVVAELGATGTAGAPMPEVISTNGRPVEAVIAELSADPAVEYAEPNYVVQLAAPVAVNDPQTSGQYSLDKMRVRDAWSLEQGGTGVVAVLDTGVMASHPDLVGRVLPGYDFVNGDTNAGDDNGHGTWVSGIIAAKPHDGYGIAGISWSDKILPVKIMNAAGQGDTADLTSGIVWAADHGATVINMSVGGFPHSQYVQDAVNYAWNRGVVLVAAAGNNRREESFYPASFANVVSVTATQVNDEFSHWSSYGPAVDVSAPGASVLTTNCYTCTYADHDSWGSHTYISGTSFAAPNVAGVVALIRAQHPEYTPTQVVSRLTTTIDDLGYRGWDNHYGRGRVNAYRALGGSVIAPGPSSGDAVEPNNTLSQARGIRLDTPTRPNLHPAGDVDVFAVDIPRAGRLQVRVTGVVDSRAYPWNRSSLQIDPIVELYTRSGSLLTRVDAVSESGTELAAVSLSGPTRILIRISNYYTNGNRSAYTVTPTLLDTISGFSDTANSPFDYDIAWLNASGITAGCGNDRFCPKATVTREQMASFLARGLHLAASTRDFFADDESSSHEADINRLAASGTTGGCAPGRFCPRASVTREQMASFLARALDLPAATRDHFSDDNASPHQADINRLAQAGVTGGCSATSFCPRSVVNREQMAAFLHRALAD